MKKTIKILSVAILLFMTTIFVVACNSNTNTDQKKLDEAITRVESQLPKKASDHFEVPTVWDEVVIAWACPKPNAEVLAPNNNKSVIKVNCGSEDVSIELHATFTLRKLTKNKAFPLMIEKTGGGIIEPEPKPDEEKLLHSYDFSTLVLFSGYATELLDTPAKNLVTNQDDNLKRLNANISNRVDKAIGITLGIRKGTTGTPEKEFSEAILVTGYKVESLSKVVLNYYNWSTDAERNFDSHVLKFVVETSTDETTWTQIADVTDQMTDKSVDGKNEITATNTNAEASFVRFRLIPKTGISSFQFRIVITNLNIYSGKGGVTPGKTDAQKVSDAINDVVVEAEATEDFKLPIGINGVTVDWTSSHAALAIGSNADGKVSIAVVRELNDVTVTLTAKFTLNDVVESRTFVVVVKGLSDTTAPTITVTVGGNELTGDVINHEVNFVNPQLVVFATDDVDGNVAVITTGDAIDWDVVGVYVVKYNAVDAAGNNAVERVITINVLPEVLTEYKVTTEQELIDAIAQGDLSIIIMENIELTSTLVINKEVFIDGNNKTISINVANTDAIWITANGVMITNLSVVNPNGYCVQVYQAIDVILENLSLDDALKAGLLVNGSEVLLTGIKLSNNTWGGIEVAQGVGVTMTPKLDIEGKINYTAVGTTPLIWIDGKTTNDGWVTPRADFVEEINGTQLFINLVQVAPGILSHHIYFNKIAGLNNSTYATGLKKVTNEVGGEILVKYGLLSLQTEGRPAMAGHVTSGAKGGYIDVDFEGANVSKIEIEMLSWNKDLTSIQKETSKFVFEKFDGTDWIVIEDLKSSLTYNAKVFTFDNLDGTNYRVYVEAIGSKNGARVIVNWLKAYAA